MPRRRLQPDSRAPFERAPTYGETNDNWEFGGTATPRERGPRRRHTRRAASTFAFVVLFFGGAAFTAVAGDHFSRLSQEDAAAPADPTATDTTTQATLNDTTDAITTTDATTEPTETTEQAPVAITTMTTTAEETSSTAEPDTADVPERTASPAPAEDIASATPHGAKSRRARRHRAARRHVALLPVVRPARMPEIEGPQRDATIWLNDPLPDPTPVAKRLSLDFARELTDASREAGVDWPVVLAVLRAQGADGTEPADARTVRRLAARLAGLADGNHSTWAVALAYGGSATFADRALALARYDRAVGLGALVHGLESAKARLSRRLLDDPSIVIYPGGRDDIANGKVDIRVLAMIAYLQEAFGEVTVSCLISGHRLYARPGVISAHIYGRAVDIAALGGTPILGHQEPGGLTEEAVRDILLLPSEVIPKQVISLLRLGGPSFSLADHYNHIHIGF